jgi:hypothetical protein
MKWEYRVVAYPLKNATESEKVLNEMGRDGWELVAIVTREQKNFDDAVFKRPAAN